MNMKQDYCFLTAFVIISFTLSLKSVVEGRFRVKRSGTNSKYINHTEEDGEITTVASEPDICKVGDEESSDAKRTKRTILYSLSNISNISTVTEATEEEVDVSILSPEFKSCTHVTLEPACYQKFYNDTVFVPLYNLLFDKPNYLIRDKLLYVCPTFYGNYTTHTKFSSHASTVTLVCLCISAICIVLHIIMFILVKRLRNLPGYILLSLCVALLSAYICIVVKVPETEHIECIIIGMLRLYFFLASFFWMNTMSYDVWRSIQMATAKLRLSADRPIMVRFARYSFYAWGIPLLIVISSIIVHHTASNIKYTLIFDVKSCWFQYKQALTIYFATPLFITLGMNILFFASSFYMILQASMTNTQPGNQSRSDLWSRLFLSLRLSSVMGFMWIFGIIAIVTEKEWLWYLFAASNALQGVFIFFSFTINERTRMACRKALKGRKCSVSPTQTSSQPATTTAV